MMDVMDAIRKQRTIRKFADRPLEEALIREILNAGRRAQSSKNSQERHFVVVRDRDKLVKLSKMGPYSGHLAGAAMGVVIVTPGYEERPSVLFDAGQAAAYMMLAAWARGTGSAITSIHESEQAKQLLGVPQELMVKYALSFGYPADPEDARRPPQQGGRKRLEEVVHWEEW